MNEKFSKELINKTFSYPFKEENFSNFSNEMFDNIDLSQSSNWISNTLIPTNIKENIDQYKILGTKEDQNNGLITVLMVKFSNKFTVERSRNIQREFAKWILNKLESDACLIAFFAENYDDWRFSFVNIDYKREKNKAGKIKAVETLSSLKRFSFLVGKNEPNYTAQAQLSPLLLDENKNPSIEKLKEAFSIEKVNKEFFENYKSLCFKIKDEIDQLLKIDHNLKKEFLNKKIISFEYSKKFMAQMIFIFFLQKKGWMGIKNKNKSIDTNLGPKNFIFNLFDKDYRDYNNFYNDILEPLFYEGLSKKTENNYFKFLNCKLPFFNISLFEPINNYDWKGTQIKIKNSTIEDLLDKFKRFNFTVNEEQDLDQEIAVDPEMLGKVLENLMQDDERKLFGVFYTPRNIVYDMCKKSLLYHLQDKLDFEDNNKYLANFISSSKLRNFDNLKKNDKKFKSFIEKFADKIDLELQKIKIIDPAVGSGAFLVEFLTLIVNLRSNLYYKKNDKILSIYNLKKFTIKNSIFGVDINKTSTEIAKMRLWLALIVDEEKYNIYKSLPNLEFNLCEGNSLSDANTLLTNIDINLMKDLKDQYYDESDSTKKKKIEKQLKLILEEYQDTNIFNFEVNFNDVFNNGGFDIVIGNPPYEILKAEQNKEKMRLKKLLLYDPAFEGELNYFKLFICKSMSLLKENGLLSFIFQYSFLGDKTCSKVRDLAINNNRIIEIEAFPERDDHNTRVFESAKMSVCTLLLKRKKIDNYSFNLFLWKDKFKKDGYVTNINSTDIAKFSFLKIPTSTTDELLLLKKIISNKNCTKLVNFSSNHDGEVHRSQHKSYYSTYKKKDFIKMYNGASIQKWYVTDQISQGEIKYVDKEKILKDFPKSDKFSSYKAERLCFQGITGINEKIRIKATLLKKNYFLEGSGRYLKILIDKIDYHSLLIIFNSSLINWFFKKFNTNSGVKSHEVNDFPILVNLKSNQKQKLINQYKKLEKIDFKNNKNDDFIKNFEKENDRIIYELYELNKKEIEIIENSKNDRF